MHGTVRLSLDFYTPVNEVLLEDSFVKTPLKYLIFICIVLSMPFLILTFAILGLLQGLQTIPFFMCFSFLCSLCSSLLFDLRFQRIKFVHGFDVLPNIYHSLLFWHVGFLWNWMYFFNISLFTYLVTIIVRSLGVFKIIFYVCRRTFSIC